MQKALTLLASACVMAVSGTAALAQQGSTPKAASPQATARKGPPAPKLPTAGGEQLAAAAMAHFGDYACEFGETVNVDVNRQNDGYLDVRHKRNLWVMKPVLSQTGALRLEDVKGRMLMLQIADKSMLMDTKVGQRVVDGCVHEKQRAATAARQAAAASAPESLGIAPASTASAAGR